MMKTLEELHQRIELVHDTCLKSLNGDTGRKSPDILYHYTSLSTLLSVLESGALRYTDARFCNDPDEVVGGLEILKQGHQDYCFNTDDPFSRIMSKIIGDLTVSLSLNNNFKRDQHDPWAEFLVAPPNAFFIACLSEKSDDLRQWFPYAENGMGVALGFKGVDQTHSLANDERVFSCRASYETLEKKSEYVKTLFSELQKIVNIIPTKLHGSFARRVHEICLGDVIANKSNNYQDEAEWRLVCQGARVDCQDLGFRMRDNIIRPYVDIQFPKESLVEIVLGPKAEKVLNEAAIRLMLDKYEYADAIIRYSSIAYRG